MGLQDKVNFILGLFKNRFNALICVLAFGLGCFITRAYFNAVIAYKAKKTAEIISAKEKDYAKRLSEVVSEMDNRNERIATLNNDIAMLTERLRHSGGNTATGKTDSVSTDATELSKCRNLLREGADLLAEGCREFGKCAIRKDALTTIK